MEKCVQTIDVDNVAANLIYKENVTIKALDIDDECLKS